MNTTVVAAIQYRPKLHDPIRNVAVAQQLAFEAANKGARVVVLPELCMSGNKIMSVGEATDSAQSRDGYQTSAMHVVSQKTGTIIVFGYIELRGGLFYNSAAVVGPAGLLANAQKHNLTGTDNMWAQPSIAEHPVVLTPAGMLGVLICRDVMNTDRRSRRGSTDALYYSRGSVDTIALLTNWGGPEYAYPDSAWVDLSEEVNANVIVSNRVGKEGDLTFKGGSCIITKTREIYTHGSSFTHAAIVGGTI